MMTTTHTTVTRLRRGKNLLRRTLFAVAAGAVAVTVAACGLATPHAARWPTCT